MISACGSGADDDGTTTGPGARVRNVVSREELSEDLASIDPAGRLDGLW